MLGEREMSSNLTNGTVVWVGCRVSTSWSKSVSFNTNPFDVAVLYRVGYPWWPALIVPYETVLFLPQNSLVPRHDDNKLPLQFFSDGRISLLPPQDVQIFDGGKALLPRQGTQFFAQIHHAYDSADTYAQCAAKRKTQATKAQIELVEALRSERNGLQKQL